MSEQLLELSDMEFRKRSGTSARDRIVVEAAAIEEIAALLRPATKFAGAFLVTRERLEGRLGPRRNAPSYDEAGAVEAPVRRQRGNLARGARPVRHRRRSDPELVSLFV